MFLLTVIGLPFVLGFWPANAGDVVAGLKLAREFGCLNCHTGNASEIGDGRRIIPLISGQNRRYLELQLRQFRLRKERRSGRLEIAERHHSVMELRSFALTDEQIDHLATYFSKRPCGKLTIEEAPKPKKAERCQFCHGERGMTPIVAHPNLAGQNEAYLIRQLQDMREGAKDPGSRNRRFHRLMAPQTIDLNNEDIAALARYYSSQSCLRKN